MTALADFTEFAPVRVDSQPIWRKVEWYGTWISLFLMSGAVFPLMLDQMNGGLGDAERAKLRLLLMPILLFTLILTARHPGQLVLAMRRTLPLALLAGLAIVSTLWSIEPKITLRRAIGLDLTMLLSYLIAIRFTPRQLLSLMSSVLGLSLIASLLLAVASPSIAFMPDGTGLRGVYTHKNVLGWAACISTILAFGLMSDPARQFRRRGKVLLVTSLICLAIAGSASSIFSLLVGTSLLGFYKLLPKTRGIGHVMLLLLALELAAIVLVVLSVFLVPFLESLGRDATLTGRIPLWALVDQRIATRPWLGFGYQAFWAPDKREVLAIFGQVQWMPPHSHNGYRDLLLNFGVVGLVLFAVILVQAMCQGAALHRAAPKEGWAWMNVVIGVMLALNLTESNFVVQNDIYSLLLMTIFVMFALRAPGNAKQPSVHPKPGDHTDIHALKAPPL